VNCDDAGIIDDTDDGPASCAIDGMRGDPVVPFLHSERLFALAGNPKALWTVPGGGHIEAFSDRFGHQYKRLLLGYLSEKIGP
jgi:fermentation-respiration switch protein FrsA (DUF1100 family)